MESISEKELIQRTTVQAHEDRALIAQLRSIRISKEQSEGLTQKLLLSEWEQTNPMFLD